MQHDPAFAARLRGGDADAAASTGLGAEEVAVLRGLDPDAVAADKDGKRAAQLVRNVTSEFALTLAAARFRGHRAFEREFAASASFHQAVSEDAPLPLAFGAFAADRVRSLADAPVAALLGLERALAAARRSAEAPVRAAPRGGYLLAGDARIVRLARGTFAWAEALRAALDAAPPAGLPPAPASLTRPDSGDESVLLAPGPAPRPYGLRAVHAEALSPLVADFLERTRAGMSAADVLAFAREHGIEPADARAVAAEYRAEGVLVGA
jgi:hypothetical protein